MLIMHFTNSRKEGSLKWVRKNRQIKGMNDLYENIATNGKLNPRADDGFFFHAQVAMQIDYSKTYKITEMEDKGSFNGIMYDNDIVLDNHICVQTGLCENMFVYLIAETLKPRSVISPMNAIRTDWYKDHKVWSKKANQPGKPYSESLDSAGNSNMVKITILAPRTHVPLLALPEWKQLLKDRIIIELDVDFDETDNLRGVATLHRLDKRRDEITMGIIKALELRYVKSFNHVDPALFRRFDGMPVGSWQTSNLYTASQSIRLRPKVATSSMNADIIDDIFVDLHGYEPPPEYGPEMVADLLMDGMGSSVWANMEQQSQDADNVIYNPNNFESVDKVIADQAQAKNSQNGLYTAYDGQLDRNKTDKFDATVVYTDYNGLEMRHIDDLLDGIWDKSGRVPDYFRGDSAALSQMLAIGHAAGRSGETPVPYNGSIMIASAFDGIPIDFGHTRFAPYTPGCIYAVSLEDERSNRTGLRLMALSSHKIHARPRNGPKYYVAFAVGEAVVDPRACGKIVHIRV